MRKIMKTHPEKNNEKKPWEKSWEKNHENNYENTILRKNQENKLWKSMIAIDKLLWWRWGSCTNHGRSAVMNANVLFCHDSDHTHTGYTYIDDNTHMHCFFDCEQPQIYNMKTQSRHIKKQMICLTLITYFVIFL